ncbi:MAG: hypothetical protein GY859_02655 [Desulfobacterales bacterium]|nr:hypothetical protein [Desulfobacterales bacterium]
MENEKEKRTRRAVKEKFKEMTPFITITVLIILFTLFYLYNARILFSE